jgi:hypothetical protein
MEEKGTLLFSLFKKRASIFSNYKGIDFYDNGLDLLKTMNIQFQELKYKKYFSYEKIKKFKIKKNILYINHWMFTSSNYKMSYLTDVEVNIIRNILIQKGIKEDN